MITVRIGDVQKECDHGIEMWISEQFQQRRKNGDPICVVVTIKKGDVHLVLATPGCLGGGAPRQLHPHEREVLEMWEKLHLNTNEFTQGNLIAFLKQVRSLC